MLREKSLKFAEDLGIESFKASTGWLNSFTKRHNIVFGKMSGERGDVNPETVNSWKEKLSTLTEGYAPENIFNMDETGLFFKDTTKHTFYIKGEDCAGGKRSKEKKLLDVMMKDGTKQASILDFFLSSHLSQAANLVESPEWLLRTSLTVLS